MLHWYGALVYIRIHTGVQRGVSCWCFDFKPDVLAALVWRQCKCSSGSKPPDCCLQNCNLYTFTCTALHRNVVKNGVCGAMCSDLVCNAFCNSMCSCNGDGNLLCSHTSQKALFLRVHVQIQTPKCRSHRLQFKSFFLCNAHSTLEWLQLQWWWQPPP